MNRFRPKQQQTEMVDMWYTAFPINVLWGIYARQSTPEQLVKNNQSTEMQTEDLVEWLLVKNVRRENISLFDADLGVSGTLRIDQRTGLQELVAHIEAGEIKAVLVYQISRLFRDETGVQYNTFADICKRHSCLLVTSDGMIFNFSNPMHMKMFRYLAEVAAEYIPQHVGMLHAARLRKAKKGLFSGLGHLPSGYIVDYAKSSKTFYKPIVYKEHGERVLYLFKRYYELDGDIGQLCRELDKLSHIFPPFGPEVDQRNVSLWKNREKPGGGYGLTRPGLETLLCNPLYIGWWIVGGDIISRDNHERIIDRENEYLFWYAFNRLSVYNIDGGKNEHRRKQSRRFFQKETTDGPGLLKSKITSTEYNVHVHTRSQGGNPHYTLIPKEKKMLISGMCDIDIDTIDNAFTEQFFTHLRGTRDFDHYHLWIEDVVKKHDTEVSSLEKQLAQIEIQQEAIIEEINDIRVEVKNKIQKMTEGGSIQDIDSIKCKMDEEAQPMIKKHRKRFNTLETTKEEISKKLEIIQKDNNIVAIQRYADFQTELEKLNLVWDKKPVNTRREFVNLFVDQAVIETVSTHWVKLTLTWSHTEWGTDILYIHLKNGRRSQWTQQEKEIIKEYYPHATQEEILALLPHKSWMSILHIAIALGITRDRTSYSYVIPRNVTWSDWQFLQEKGIDLDDRSTKYESSLSQG